MVPEDLCKLSPSVEGALASGKAPFTRDTPACPKNDPMCDVADAPPDAKDACFVATKNLARAERDAHSTPRGGRVASAPWDGAGPPRYLDRIDRVVRLSSDEREKIRANGFTVLDRVGYDSYAHGFHGVFQSQLPVYVGADAVLQAIYRANESILASLERQRLGPALVRALDKLLRAALVNEKLYGAELTRDLQVYLGVARSILPGGESLWLAARDEIVALRDGVASGEGNELVTVESLFGRARVVDATQFRPRGHYAELGPPVSVGKEQFGLDLYFRAVTWLSRIELNLVSRSGRSSHPGPGCDTSATPREVRLALALDELLRTSGAAADLAEFERVYTTFAGVRQDVSPATLGKLANGTRPTAIDAASRVAAAIGNGYRRTARSEFTLDCVRDLPVILTLLGPRSAPDTGPLSHLVHGDVPERTHLGAADVAYLLGHDRARTYLANDLASHPTLEAKLAEGRKDVFAGVNDPNARDLYSLWLRAIARLSDTPRGNQPSFTAKDAFKDYRMNSAIAAYAGLRKSFALLVAEGYDAYGCEIPDGYVEPAIGTYEALRDYVAAASAIDPSRRGYYDRVQKVLAMLIAISKTELEGSPLSEPQKRWLGMVAEYIPTGGYADSGMPPTYTGWYFDLFPDREKGAFTRPELVADYFTLTNDGTVAHVGVEGVRLGVFVVDTGGEPRAMVGPVAKAYEAHVPISEGRLTDRTARAHAGKRAPWLGYVAKAPPPLPIALSAKFCDGTYVAALTSDVALGDVSLTFTDHHGDPIGPPVTTTVANPGRTIFHVAWTPDPSLSHALRRRGPAEGWDLAVRLPGAKEARHALLLPNASDTASFDPYDPDDPNPPVPRPAIEHTFHPSYGPDVGPP